MKKFRQLIAMILTLIFLTAPLEALGAVINITTKSEKDFKENYQEAVLPVRMIEQITENGVKNKDFTIPVLVDREHNVYAEAVSLARMLKLLLIEFDFHIKMTKGSTSLYFDTDGGGTYCSRIDGYYKLEGAPAAVKHSDHFYIPISLVLAVFECDFNVISETGNVEDRKLCCTFPRSTRLDFLSQEIDFDKYTFTTDDLHLDENDVDRSQITAMLLQALVGVFTCDTAYLRDIISIESENKNVDSKYLHTLLQMMLKAADQELGGENCKVLYYAVNCASKLTGEGATFNSEIISSTLEDLAYSCEKDISYANRLNQKLIKSNRIGDFADDLGLYLDAFMFAKDYVVEYNNCTKADKTSCDAVSAFLDCLTKGNGKYFSKDMKQSLRLNYYIILNDPALWSLLYTFYNKAPGYIVDFGGSLTPLFYFNIGANIAILADAVLNINSISKSDQEVLSVYAELYQYESQIAFNQALSDLRSEPSASNAQKAEKLAYNYLKACYVYRKLGLEVYNFPNIESYSNSEKEINDEIGKILSSFLESSENFDMNYWNEEEMKNFCKNYDDTPAYNICRFKVEGDVLDAETGEPIANAKIQFASDDGVTVSAESSDQGKYECLVLLGREYSALAEAKCYEPLEKKVENKFEFLKELHDYDWEMEKSDDSAYIAYLEDVLIPKYGLADLSGMEKTFDNTSAFNDVDFGRRTGLFGARIRDLNGDGTKDMIAYVCTDGVPYHYYEYDDKVSYRDDSKGALKAMTFTQDKSGNVSMIDDEVLGSYGGPEYRILAGGLRDSGDTVKICVERFANAYFSNTGEYYFDFYDILPDLSIERSNSICRAADGSMEFCYSLMKYKGDKIIDHTRVWADADYRSVNPKKKILTDQGLGRFKGILYAFSLLGIPETSEKIMPTDSAYAIPTYTNNDNIMVRDFRIKNYASNSDVYRRHIVSKAEDFTEIRKIIGYGEGEDSESGQTPESGKKSGSGASGAETPETIKKHIDNHEFIVPESDTRVLTQNEIAVLVSAGYYKDETVVQWAINEIYAKNGFKFSKSQTFIDYYSYYSWYGNNSLSDQEAKAKMNEISFKNLQLLIDAREKGL